MISAFCRHSHCRTLLLLVGTCYLFSCDVNEKGENGTPNQENQSLASDRNIEGKSLAQQYCASCHQYVPPEVLPTEYWKTVLTKMSRYMGFNRQGDPYYGHSPIALRRLDSARIFPAEQVISNEDWQELVLFYLNESPDTLDQGIRPPIDFNLNQFNVRTIPWKTPLQGPTFVEVLEYNQIAVGFSMLQDKNDLIVIDVNGNEILRRNIPSALTSIDRINDEIYFSFMGLFEADDTPMGTLGKVTGSMDLTLTDSIEIIYKDRERPVHINAIDVNEDLRIDLIVAEFGKFLGGLYLYVQKESGGYEKKTLYNGPGAIMSIIRDVNRDGLPDFYVLTSQGNEGVSLFINQGNTHFEEKKILQFPPYYGSSHMELIDFDGDGLEDIIYSNGDSGDFGYPAKPFHGIRFFRGKENQVFEEEWFYPQQGTYKTQIVDFDQDGDFDIAAIGFFAYGASMPEEGFLYLENTGYDNGQVQFKTYSFRDAAKSSYMVMDAGDIDGDGDEDLILGASSSLMNVTEMVGQLLEWETNGGAIVLLENTLK